MRRLFFLLLPLSFAASPALAEPLDELLAASAAVRVGAPAEALGHLDAARFEGEASQVAAFLRAHALVQLGRTVEAEARLAEVREAALALPVALVRFEAAVARAAPAEIVAAADAVLRFTAAPAGLLGVARLQRAKALLTSDAPAGEAALRALVAEPPSAAIAAQALEALALRGDRTAERTLRVQFAATEEGRRAADRAPPEHLSPEDQLARARRLFEQRAYGLAEADFARLAAESKDAAVRQEADLRIGVIRMRLREGYDRALNHLRSARGGPDRAMADEAQYRIGLVLGNLHRYEEASKAMATYLERAPRGPFAESAGYQVGRLLHQAGQFDAAIAAHERFLAKKRRDHGKYVWFLGWSHFRKGDCATARRIWAPSIGSRNLLVGPKALYWTARCQRLEGDMAGAAATLATLAERAPLSYYGVLGAALDGRLPPRPSGWPIALPTAPDTRPFEEALPAAWRAKVRVARLLAWAGYPALARDAVDATAVRKAAPTAQREAFGATLDALLERFGDRWRTLPRADRRAPWNERLATHPEAELREILPPAWIALARAAGVAPGEEGDISPWWLLAHMLQESRYKARARSHAGALGPMQILPRTGRLIAARLGFPAGDFFDERLFDPGVALRHAAWYLDALRHEYRGNLVLAMAAYNGGPRRVGEHLETVPDLPFDVSIEEIGAHESRNYCRKVVDHLVRYVSLYGTDAERAAVLAALQPPAKAPAPRGEIRF